MFSIVIYSYFWYVGYSFYKRMSENANSSDYNLVTADDQVSPLEEELFRLEEQDDEEPRVRIELTKVNSMNDESPISEIVKSEDILFT
jgi:hypothetical protein